MSANQPLYAARRQAQRDTWLKTSSVDYRFFVGGAAPERDVINLDVADDYNNFPLKVQAAVRWARQSGYQRMVKLDDDVYMRPERLDDAYPKPVEYVGRVRGPSGKKPAPYCSGFTYVLGMEAMDVVMSAEWDGSKDEDQWVGNLLLAAGIYPRADYRFVIEISLPNSNRAVTNSTSSPEGPRMGNSIISSSEYGPDVNTADSMYQAHAKFLQNPSRIKAHQPLTGPLDDICIMVKTFLRDGFLYKCLDGIQQNLPECKIVVVDDGREQRDKITRYTNLMARGHSVLWLPFDSGFGAKANAALAECDRKYVLVASDDFMFAAATARRGVERLHEVLEHDQEMALASGRVNGNPYEHSLTIVGDTCIEERETRAERCTPTGVKYSPCDLTVNYSLIRRDILGPDKLHWDGGAVKIGGGEHGAFFIDLMRAGLQACYVSEVNIGEYKFDPCLVQLDYAGYRRRARQPGRPCLKVRGINRWRLAGGVWEDC